MRNDPRVAPWARRFVESEYQSVEPETIDGEIIGDTVNPVVAPRRHADLDAHWFRRVLLGVVATWLLIFGLLVRD